MANSFLTPSVITKEALAILHQKLNFVGNINTQYDDQYAKTGAKIGNDLKIRLPNEFTVRSGASLSTQDITESSVTMTVDTQKGVDFTPL
jgi:ornithine carbamoyltransferase